MYCSQCPEPEGKECWEGKDWHNTHTSYGMIMKVPAFMMMSSKAMVYIYIKIQHGREYLDIDEDHRWSSVPFLYIQSGGLKSQRLVVCFHDWNIFLVSGNRCSYYCSGETGLGKRKENFFFLFSFFFFNECTYFVFYIEHLGCKIWFCIVCLRIGLHGFTCLRFLGNIENDGNHF